MTQHQLSFSIVKHAHWLPGFASSEEKGDRVDFETLASALQNTTADSVTQAEPPPVKQMPAMLRRRARFLGRMALEVAYACLGDATVDADIPMVFCSRHGDVALSIELLQAQIKEGGVSPIGFSSAVHNATPGLFSIARQDRSNHLAIAAGATTVEHALIEACGLLADGAAQVLVVHYEQPLPALLKDFVDNAEATYAWAWLLEAAQTSKPEQNIFLGWETLGESANATQTPDQALAPGLAILEFQLAGSSQLQRRVGQTLWSWSRHV